METEIVVETPNTAHSDKDMLQCPTCDAKIRRSEMAEHCRLELERLTDIQKQNLAHSANNTIQEAAEAGSSTETTNARIADNADSDAPATSNGGEQRRKPWSVFQRVQRNRQARQRSTRTRKRAASPAQHSTAPTETSGTVTCPVCNQNFPQLDIQRHVNQCLRRSKSSTTNGTAEPESSDDDDSEEYEEYEWAGQKRVRVSTLVPGGLSTLALGQTIKYNGSQQNNDDEEEDLNVDEDDTQIYGPAQYGETDVIPLLSDDSGGAEGNSELISYMRRLIASGNNTNTSNHSNAETSCATPATSNSSISQKKTNHMQTTTTQPTSDRKSATVDGDNVASSSSVVAAPATSVTSAKSMQQCEQIIEALKIKLRLYESQIQSKFKCLICIDDYKNPAISVSCWHVYCEQCWLRTLGARKLCPQCNSITTPKDLRRIYL